MTGTEYLIKLNEHQSSEFVHDKARRRRWREKHPTEVSIFECMDGRVHFPAITGTPLGIAQSWRNIGGIFNLFEWERFQNSVYQLWCHAKRHDRHMLWIVTDHFSRSTPELGCRGYGYDLKKAQTSSRALKQQFDQIFGGDCKVATIHATIETDEDALIFHGDNGDCLDLSRIKEDASTDDIKGILTNCYPNTPEKILNDLLEPAMRNLAHIANIRKAKRPLAEAEHREWVLAVGQGFDWLHEINMALIVGPFDPELSRWVRVAGKILAENTKRRDFNRRRGVVLLASAQFSPDSGEVGRRFAERKALKIADQAARIIQRNFPELESHLHYLTGTVDVSTQRLYVLDGN